MNPTPSTKADLPTFCRAILRHPEARRALRREFLHFLWIAAAYLTGVIIHRFCLHGPLDAEELSVGAAALLVFWLIRVWRTVAGVYREFRATAPHQP